MIKRTSITNPTSMYTSEYYNLAKYCGKTGYFNGRYKNGYQCVNYAVARACEIAQKAVCYYSGISTKDQIEKPMFNRYGYGNAVEWLNTTLWEHGDTPKIGAIMVYGKAYGGGYGHVRVVEDIVDGKIVYSGANESNDIAFKTISIPTVSTTGFLGYIYNPYVTEFNVQTVSRDATKDQVEILADSLNVRDSANGNLTGCFATKGLYDVLAFETKGNYTWAKLAENVWIALNDKDNWTITYLKDSADTYKTKYDELLAKYNALESDYKVLLVQTDNLTTQNKNLTTSLETANSTIGKLSEQLARIKEIVNE